MKTAIFLILVLLLSYQVGAQTGSITGMVKSGNRPIPFVSVELTGTGFGTTTDSLGRYFIEKLPAGSYTIRASYIGYAIFEKAILLGKDQKYTLPIQLSATGDILNQVVITAFSGSVRIRESPLSVVPVSNKQIEQTSESNIIDVLVKRVPGLNAVKTGPNISKPFIRGLGYNRVLTLYDGIRQEGQQWGDEHGIEVDAYNIDRAEVIKGPASLMYGSDALAGVVSLFPYEPKDPDGKWHGKITSEYQSNNNLVGNGFRLNYKNQSLVYAVRGSFRISKNYRNPVDGRVYLTNFNEKNFSTLLGFKSARGYSNLNFTLYENRQGIPDGSRDSLSRKFTKQLYEGIEDTIATRPVVSSGELNSYTVPALSQHIQHYRVYLHSFYQIGNGGLDMLWGIQKNIRKEYNHPTMPKQAGMHVLLNTMNYGIRYNSKKFLNMDISLGINGMLQSNKSVDATDFPIPNYELFDGGAYTFVKWKRNKWSFSGGFRYDLRQVHWNDFYVGTNAKTGFDEQLKFPDTANGILQFPAYRKGFQGTSASVGLTLQASNNICIKANVGRAYRAPNITEIASNGLDPGAHIIYLGNRNFNPEFSLQEDIGISARYSYLSADLSLFNNNIRHYIYLNVVTDSNGNPLVDAQGNKTYQYQQAGAHLYGAELWLAIHPEKMGDMRFENSLSWVYGTNKNKALKGKKVEGEYLLLIPPFKWISTVSRPFDIDSKRISPIDARMEMEWTAAQYRYLGLNNTETPTAGYVLFNMSVSTGLKYHQSKIIQIHVGVNNLLNKAYQSHLSRLKYFEYYNQSSNGYEGIYNMGRNICFKVILPF